MIYLDDKNLTEHEKSVRFKMVYVFNPILKQMLYEANPVEFARYGYNCCRQTAFMGSGTLSMLLGPQYKIKCYEGKFKEPVNGKIEEYEHAFIVAHNGSKQILVDLSRTTKPLLFRVFTDESDMYPVDGKYSEMTYISKTEKNWMELITHGMGEYLSGKLTSTMWQQIMFKMNMKVGEKEEELIKEGEASYRNFTGLVS